MSVFGSAGFVAQVQISETVEFLVFTGGESVVGSTGFVWELGISETFGLLVSVAGEFSGFVSTGFVAKVASAFFSSNLVSVFGVASAINSLSVSDVRKSDR
ncbi:MAG: hypothetical protein EAZ83_31340 [Oscillatoriales cyanobacterium]|uniref:hypothetical protein n=1 Tax=unclassified Microcoleus TaxID=2642155 RepID=UPI001DC6FC14|nr:MULTISPECIES: hypothetical protein [unclassified Microcoleus]MCC3464185.1 hypothetical protein [Microcoleus sp. PH2017_11_PCY_U_A]MCC3532354.1 hypothetical protein [Microcoleus sp. PH2017_21_RUC_O_A]MCC3544650.1 hypothetical protein [Microcoleus sp. PH2017_22_RUC_O_B]TAE73580.1 MAG: hypothetical protein EAZ83_31340 [Oscillatoriales cyanobacterium]